MIRQLVIVSFFGLLLTGCEVLTEVAVPEVSNLPTEKPLKADDLVSGTIEPTLTQTPLNSLTPTLLPTRTPTQVPTPAPTSIPIYTVLGKQINDIVGILGWEIDTCSFNVDVSVEELRDRGVFLYREDTGEHFCDLFGYMEEPVPDPFPDGQQYLLYFGETHGYTEMFGNELPDGFRFQLHVSYSIYYANPSQYNADDLAKISYDVENLGELRGKGLYTALIRAWPLSYQEYLSLAKSEEIEINISQSK